MREIFTEYGNVIVTVVAVLLVIVVVTAVIGTDGNGLVGRAFSSLIQQFFDTANANAGLDTESTESLVTGAMRVMHGFLG